MMFIFGSALRRQTAGQRIVEKLLYYYRLSLELNASDYHSIYVIRLSSSGYVQHE
jgi:hypothetical protein